MEKLYRESAAKTDPQFCVYLPLLPNTNPSFGLRAVEALSLEGRLRLGRVGSVGKILFNNFYHLLPVARPVLPKPEKAEKPARPPAGRVARPKAGGKAKAAPKPKNKPKPESEAEVPAKRPKK